MQAAGIGSSCKVQRKETAPLSGNLGVSGVLLELLFTGFHGHVDEWASLVLAVVDHTELHVQNDLNTNLNIIKSAVVFVGLL